MSRIAFNGNALGTGTLTIASPNTNSDRTVTLPDATGTINISGATNEVPSGSASAPSIYPTGDTNTGIFFPAADTLAFAEGGVEVGRFDSSSNFQFNSGYGSVATAYGCRAWVNFNGTGTVAIRGSGNISSITDNGTGDYTLNFATALADANYCPVGMGIDVSGAQVIVRRGSTAQTTSACRVSSEQPGTSSADCSQVNVAIFR